MALPSFVEEFEFGKLSAGALALRKANIVSVYQAGAFFGSFGAYASSHFLGRRKSLLIWVMVFILGAGMMLGANRERGLGLIIGGRVLAGLGVGAASNVSARELLQKNIELTRADGSHLHLRAIPTRC